MSDFREEEKLGKLFDSRLTHRLMQYLRPYRWPVIIAITMSLAITSMDIVGPWLFGYGIDRYVVPGSMHDRTSTPPSSDLRPDDHRAGLPRLDHGQLRAAISSDAHHAMGRPADDVRRAPRNFRPPATPVHELLRPQPGRPPGHSLYHGRGRAERFVCHRRRGDAQRFCLLFSAWPSS